MYLSNQFYDVKQNFLVFYVALEKFQACFAAVTGSENRSTSQGYSFSLDVTIRMQGGATPVTPADDRDSLSLNAKLRLTVLRREVLYVGTPERMYHCAG